MRRPLRIITGMQLKPLSCARHQRGAPNRAATSKAPSLRKATSDSPGSGIWMCFQFGSHVATFRHAPAVLGPAWLRPAHSREARASMAQE